MRRTTRMGTMRGGRAGFTLLELTISATILFLLAAMMVEAVDQIGSLGRAGGTAARLQMGAAEALTRITTDLHSSGFVNANGKTYPYLFEDGAADSDFAVHAHVPAAEHAAAGEADEGVNREMVCAIPAFVSVVQGDDGANYPPDAVPGGVTVVKVYDVPQIDANGSAIWSVDEVSYVLVTAADGVNELQRRVNGASPTVLARGVERILFDTGAIDLAVPLRAVRVRLWLRLPDGEGTVHRHFAEAVVRLQNGG